MIGMIGFRRFSLLILTGVGFALSWGAERYAGEFLLDVESPRARAMGGVGAWLPDGGFDVARNAAYLADVKEVGVSLLHTDQFTGIVHNDFVGVESPGKGSGIGFAMYRTGVDQIPYTQLLDPSQAISGTNRVMVNRYVTDQEWAFWVGMGRKFGDKFTVGAAVKPIVKILGGGTGIGFGLDGGLKCQLMEHASVAAAVSDIVTSPIRWNTSRTELIKPRLQTGATYDFEVPRLHASILAAGGVEVRSDEGGSNLISGHGGIEYTIEHIIALRAGYDADRPVFGAGIRTKSIDFDYAYRDQPLGVSHLIGINYRMALNN